MTNKEVEALKSYLESQGIIVEVRGENEHVKIQRNNEDDILA